MDLSAKLFVPIPIHEFVQGVTIHVNLFIRLGDDKFVQVGRAGQLSDVAQFKNYENKEVHYLWVHKDEYHRLAHQAMTLAGIAVSKSDLTDNQRTTLVTHAARSIFRQLEHLGVDAQVYNNAKQVTEAVVAMVEANKSFAALFASLAHVSDQLLAHSMAVSSFSVLLGHAMGFEKKVTLEKLALGGMLHDMGLKALPADIVKKPLAMMTQEEIQIYETHPYKGMQMLTSLGMVPDDIVSIVYEHHENSVGQGFPQRLRDVKMHPLAKVVALADAYADLTLQNVNSPSPKNAREAVIYIEHTLGVPYNREVFRALKRLLDNREKRPA
ncbi:MAG: HD-GYP domain-containing protein [Bdellovibrionales bacterium]